MKKYKYSQPLLAAAPICLAFAIQALPTIAGAETESNADAVGLDEVVVTARKRSERLLDTPVAVVAFTSQNIEQQGIYSLSDLAQATPGMTDNSTLGGSGRNDRSFPQYIIRGMNPSSTLNPTTTVFIDGVPIISGQVDALDDLERVEVLEGPQTAYFGRETFGGAINLVTKDPSNVFGGTASILAGDPNYYDARLSVEGAIIPDFLTARATYRYYTRSGSYRNEAVADVAPPGRLGDQSTQSESLELVAKPIENLKIKALYMYWADRDGPSAQGLVNPSQSDCNVTANGLSYPWFCGTAPTAAGRQPAANTLVDPTLAAYLRTITNKTITGAGAQALNGLPDKFGLERDAYHWSVGVDYDIPSLFTLSYLTGTDYQVYGELQDLDNSDTSAVPNPYSAFAAGSQSYANFPFYVESVYRSVSQELRLTSEQAQQFRYMVGMNYYWTRTDQALGGDSYFGPAYYPHSATSSNNTSGFFGLAYDFTSQFTLNLEGRFERAEQDGAGVKGSFNNFTPRAIAQYKFTPDIMAYATFSEGVNPGLFNTFILGLSAANLEYLEKVYGASVIVRPEKLKNYELGLKGRFLDNSLEVSGDVYHDIWTDQINTASVNVIGPNGAPDLTTAYLNNGRVNLDGLEIKANWRPISHLDLDASGAINKTDIKQGACQGCGPFPSSVSSDVDGNQLPNVSKYQAAAGMQYGDAVTFMPNWDYFARVDDNFKSSSYATSLNYVKTPNLNFVNMRAGLTHDTLRVEAFVDNLTNEGGATNLATITNLANPFGFFNTNSLVAGLPELRTYGIRVKYKFGGAK